MRGSPIPGLSQAEVAVPYAAAVVLTCAQSHPRVLSGA